MESNVGSEDQRPGGLGDNDRSAEDAANQRVYYTIPGVLHFLQTECARMEAERAQFELERTELQARIAFLEGERRAQDNLKKDLVRRIRMLECALMKEREKTQSSSQHNASVQPDNDENRKAEKSENNEELARLGLSAQPVEDLEELLQNLGQTKTQKARSQMISEGRQLLRKYLQEIGYADTIVDVRSARVRALLGLEPVNNCPPNGPGSSTSPLPPPPSIGGRQPLGSGQANHDSKVKLPEDIVSSAEQSVIDTFAFLRSSDLASQSETTSDDFAPELKRVLRPQKDGDLGSEEDAAALNELNALLKSTNMSSNRDSLALRLAEAEMSHEMGSGAHDEQNEGNQTAFGPNSSPRSSRAGQTQQQGRPEVRFCLRSHYDAVRAIAFHPTEAAIVSASDDTTVKLWSLDKNGQAGLAASPSPQIRRSGGGGSGGQSLASVISDLEPLQTFRNQSTPILCAALGSNGDRLYTGGLDGSLACYSLHSLMASVADIYDPFDASRCQAFLPHAHDDAIWQLATHPTRHSLLATCGADGAVRLWNVGGDSTGSESGQQLMSPEESADKYSAVANQPVLLRMMNGNDSKPAFSAVDFSRVDYTQLIAATASNTVYVFDFETGVETARIESICPAGSTVYDVVSHPTLPLAALACEDGFIRVVDLAAAAGVYPASPLPDSVVVATLPTPAPVSSVAIDESGVYLLAGCHDGSVRLWNLETRACHFDDTVAHHRKFDEGVLSVAIHPSRPLFASAGADGAVRVYRW